MKNCIILLICLLFATVAIAQKEGYVTVSRGVVFPLGTFANTDLAEDFGGAAKIGSNIDISFAYGEPEKLGFALVMRYQVNPTDEKGLIKSFQPEIDNVTVDSKKWYFYYLMAGLHKPFNINDKLVIDTKVTIGVSNCFLPEMRILQLSPWGGGAYYGRSMSLATSWAALLGIGAQLTVTPSVILLAKMDLLATRPYFKDISLQHEEWYTPLDEEYHQVLLSTSTSIGLGLKF